MERDVAHSWSSHHMQSDPTPWVPLPCSATCVQEPMSCSHHMQSDPDTWVALPRARKNPYPHGQQRNPPTPGRAYHTRNRVAPHVIH
jgi:hypothetical protein